MDFFKRFIIVGSSSFIRSLVKYKAILKLDFIYLKISAILVIRLVYASNILFEAN